jgi:hypothetical protein
MTELCPEGDPWLFDLLIAALDVDLDHVNALIAERTDHDPARMGELIGVLLAMILAMGEETTGGKDQLRERLRELAVLQALTGITG